jgi:hypothetical protein
MRLITDFPDELANPYWYSRKRLPTVHEEVINLNIGSTELDDKDSQVL